MIKACYIFIFSFLTFNTNSSAALGVELEIFSIKESPRAPDWRHFHRLSQDEKGTLWAYHKGRHAEFKDWNWAWRLGWVRSCAATPGDFCSRLIEEGLADRAMVVRAEAAEALGQRFEGTRDSKVVRLLRAAYSNPSNIRGGKPLFVQFRILYALTLVGGDEALAVAGRLSDGDARMHDYWAKLAKF